MQSVPAALIALARLSADDPALQRALGGHPGLLGRLSDLVVGAGGAGLHTAVWAGVCVWDEGTEGGEGAWAADVCGDRRAEGSQVDGTLCQDEEDT